jgi:sugar lactone lactonase YvrE
LRRILRANVFMNTVEQWEMPQEPGCIAPAASGGLVIALRDGIYRARSWGGALDLIRRFDHDVATMRFNDGKADPLGRMWAGTMYEPRGRKTAALYSIDCRDGAEPRIETKAGNGTIANGLAWSPDTKTVYWADTATHTVWAWDWDTQSNAMANQRVFLQFPGKPEGWRFGQPGYGGRPDGAAVDAQGNYCCAMFEGARVLKFSPAGALLQEIAIPAQCPTMPCFGGDDLKTLYVTTACKNRSAEELRAYPDSGRVFSIRVETPGLPVNFFRD